MTGMKLRDSALQIFLAAILLGLTACANPEMPPGGPRDLAAPQIVEVQPASGSTFYDGGPITINFDEWVRSDGLKENIFVSPPAEFELDWSGPEVEIRFTEELAANTTYAITIGAEVRDYRGNSDECAYQQTPWTAMIVARRFLLSQNRRQGLAFLVGRGDDFGSEGRKVLADLGINPGTPALRADRFGNRSGGPAVDAEALPGGGFITHERLAYDPAGILSDFRRLTPRGGAAG